jgi:Uma2 family endonuclease
MDVGFRAGQWTLDDLFELPDSIDRYEVIDGNLIVSPAPAPFHQFVGTTLLSQLVAAAPAEWIPLYESYVDYGGDARVPDLLVVRAAGLHRRGKAFAPADVGLAVEIVSPSSRRTDRLAKPAEYAEQGIAQMWRVELEPDVVVHPFRLVGGQWSIEPEVRSRGIVPVPWGVMELDLSALAAME